MFSFRATCKPSDRSRRTSSHRSRPSASGPVVPAPHNRPNPFASVPIVPPSSNRPNTSSSALFPSTPATAVPSNRPNSSPSISGFDPVVRTMASSNRVEPMRQVDVTAGMSRQLAASGNPARISVLPDQVAAKLTGTALITTVGDVVAGLLANSIDGGATKVEISWRVRDGYVDVVDDGLGIHPDDISLVGEKIGTSRQPADAYNGVFLFALAQISQLHVFSRHTGWVPTHVTRFNFGKKVDHQIEVNESRRLTKMGTKVWVRNLFGDVAMRAHVRRNMPPAEERKVDRDTHRKIVEVLLCAPDRDLRVTVHDDKRRSGFVLNATDTGLARRKKILVAAGFPSIDWKPASAEWGDIKVDAIIGAKPVIDSMMQFITINGAPVRKFASIYARVNSIFSASDFATFSSKFGQGKYVAYIADISVSEMGVHRWNPLDLDGPACEEVFRLLESLMDQFLREGGYRVKRKAAAPPAVTEPVAKKPRMPSGSVPSVVREPWEGKSRSSANVPRNEIPQDDSLRQKAIAVVQRERQARAATMAAAAPPAPRHVVHPLLKPARRCTAERSIALEPRLPVLAPSRFVGAERVAMLVRDFEEDERRLEQMQVPPRVIPREEFNDGPVFAVPQARIHKPVSSREGRPYTDLGDGKMVTLNKRSLETARVLPRQMSDKFILGVTEEPHALIAADQHATDERIRLEALWRNYDPEPKPLQKPISFRLPFREGERLCHHLAQVREWGFVLSVAPAEDNNNDVVVEVHGAQELVAERCVTDPSVVIEIITDWAAQISDDGFKGYPAGRDWVKRQSSAPQKLADVFSSRACRSAIMFNDELTHAECIALIRNLAKCRFPFICAHGRPTVVPIFDLTAGGVLEPFTEWGETCWAAVNSRTD
ncbi:DNA mismatch repair protein [Orbilia brochopaga]|uniref:DNA mismatch repair protein n=1 Tax=Orbilia brochopaga TaxID=3140254 RepID=A0AAV9V183_9PEZI